MPRGSNQKKNEKSKLWSLTKVFVRKIAPVRTFVRYLKVLAKAAIRGDVSTIYTVLEVQKMEGGPDLFIGPLFKSIKWVNALDKLQQAEWGARFKLLYKIRGVSSSKSDLIARFSETIYEMEDPRRVVLRWKTLQRSNPIYKDRQTSEVPNKGEDPDFDNFLIQAKRQRKIRNIRDPRERRKAWRMFNTQKLRQDQYHQRRHRRSNLGDYSNEIKVREPRTSSNDDFDYEDMDISASNLFQEPSKLTEVSKKAILRMTGKNDPLLSAANLLITNDDNIKVNSFVDELDARISAKFATKLMGL